MWCVMVWKSKQRGPPPTVCESAKIARQVELLLAQQKVTEECGLQEIIPRLWVDKVGACARAPPAARTEDGHMGI